MAYELPTLAVLLGGKRLNFKDKGACSGCNPNLFFPEPHDQRTVKAAKAVCAGCVVREECLEWALDSEEKYGIWGGTSENERRVMRRVRRTGTTEPDKSRQRFGGSYRERESASPHGTENRYQWEYRHRGETWHDVVVEVCEACQQAHRVHSAEIKSRRKQRQELDRKAELDAMCNRLTGTVVAPEPEMVAS